MATPVLCVSSACKFRVKDDDTSCPNQSCSSQKLPGSFSANQEFNVLVSFSDHTGGLDGVVLAGSVAEEIFQHSVNHKLIPSLYICIYACPQVQEFVTMTSEQRTELKVQLLLERFKVIIRTQVSEICVCSVIEHINIRPDNSYAHTI